MELLLVILFILGYLSITLEHTLKVDKLIPALIMMALMWAGVAFGLDGFVSWYDSHAQKLIEGFAGFGHEERLHIMENTLLHHFGKTAEILIFLLGAMTIVEITDYFNGFGSIKQFVRTRDKRVLLWIVGSLAFVLSSIIDNLTATIVLITILRKLVPDSTDRKWYAGYHHYCCQCRWCMVAHWRCDYNHVVDRQSGFNCKSAYSPRSSVSYLRNIAHDYRIISSLI
jgi:hypothetical protein